MIEKVYDDNTLSFKEKGLYTAIYLNETMNVDQLVESGKDKADAVRSGLKKLIEKQYIKKVLSGKKTEISLRYITRQLSKMHHTSCGSTVTT